MGSSCSSAQKKKDKDKNAQDGQSPMDCGRRRSTDSLPYGKGSPPSSRRPSFDPNSAPAPVAEQVESPTGTSDATQITKIPVAAALSQASTVGGGSSSSPPPSGGTMGTPVSKDAPSLDAIGLPDLQVFPEVVRSLILGRVSELEADLLPPLQEIMLYVSADHYDSASERDVLAERVFPALRKYTAEKGYDLNVADLHWGIPGVGIVDHSLRDLCIGTLEHWRTRRRLLTLILFNDNIGVPLMPRSMPKPHFAAALEAMACDEDRELFHKWYHLDENASLSSYVLRPVTDLVSDKEQAEEERSALFTQWKDDAKKMLQILRDVLPDGQKAKYLTSVLEDEINVMVSDDPQESKRVLWTQRRFTHAKPSEPNQDLRRVDQAKLRLEDYLPDTQKLVFYVKWHEGDYDQDNDEEDARYMNEVCESIKEELTKMIDSLLEEDFLEEAQRPYRGIESNLYAELIQQYSHCRTLSENFLGRNNTLQAVRTYLETPVGRPLVIHGPKGCGKSHLVARCVADCSKWLPTAPIVVRFVGLTAESATHEQLLRSILEQCCALYGEHPAVASESVQDWGSGLERLLEKVSESRPLVVLIDGLDQMAFYASSCSKKNFHWLPKELPPYVKLVLTVSNDRDELRQMKEILGDDNECFLQMDNLSTAEGWTTVEKAIESKKRRLTAAQKDFLKSCVQGEPCSRYCELLREIVMEWPASLEPDDVTIEKTIESIMAQYLTHAELYLGRSFLTFILGVLISAKHGVADSEMLDLLSCEETVINFVFYDKEPRVRRFPAVLWVLAKKLLGPFITSQVLGGRTLIFVSSLSYRTAMLKYLEEKEHNLESSAQVLADYFFGKWAEEKKRVSADDEDSAKERFVIHQPLAYGPNPNRRKLDELPYQVMQIGDSIRENFLFDATWLLYKCCGSDPYQLLEDIAGYENKSDSGDEETKLLTWVMQLSSYPLRCDGSQFFAQMYGRLHRLFTDADAADRYPSVKTIYDTAERPPLSSLLPLGPCLKEPTLGVDSPIVNCVSESPPSTPAKKGSPFSGFYTIKGDLAHVISLSCDRGEIIVWNIYDQMAVRKMTGINQPKDIKMIDQYRALVLCNRELKVFHLDQGTLLVKLKGVMNQKMAYYGLHDESYAVSLSRNRMYVNMTNLNTGDLETTFKVGEDRFLNSLLVSANGRICVCGDETQKPFPLLVWDLGSRKLVYDLRIPHHEFVTRLSAISDDGHYVVSVCRELHDTSPNFIIVYDLQSGTLFKKWKPESSSCSIAISSQGMCVVNGLENTWVLVWDLSTGARRYTLRGHNAPVDQIRIEEEGNRCLTYDSKGRDRSLRVWDVTKGECLAVFTPDVEFSCCELSLDGRAVVLGLKDRDTITTLLLCRENTIEEARPEPSVYGDEEKKGQTFDMSREGQ